MTKVKTYLGILVVSGLLYAIPVFGGHFEEPATSPILMHLVGSLTIDGEGAMPGDEVGIFSKSGKIVGTFVVEKKGIFGDIAITGDDELTYEHEGTLGGESLEIRVWQKSTNREYSGGDIHISSPVRGQAIYTPYPGTLLQFEGETFYLLNIEVAE